MNRQILQSLPSRERGLKYCILWGVITRMRSLPSRERGLKSEKLRLIVLNVLVAPLAGAWIEIFLYYKKTVGMFIPLLRNGQEKMVSVSVVGEDRIIYISSDMFKLYEQGLSEPDGIRLKKEFYLSLCSEEVCYV